MAEWFSRATSTFFGMAVALGLLAVPTYNWLTRELDAQAARSDSHDENFSTVLEKLDVLEALGNEAKHASETSVRRTEVNQDMLALLAAGATHKPDFVANMISASLPIDASKEFFEEEKQNYFRAITMDGSEFLFLEKSKLKHFDLNERRLLRDLSSTGGPELIVWDPLQFPGYAFD